MRMSSLSHSEKLIWPSWPHQGHEKSHNKSPCVRYDKGCRSSWVHLSEGEYCRWFKGRRCSWRWFMGTHLGKDKWLLPICDWPKPATYRINLSRNLDRSDSTCSACLLLTLCMKLNWVLGRCYLLILSGFCTPLLEVASWLQPSTTGTHILYRVLLSTDDLISP
jgi:hypothetical protein